MKLMLEEKIMLHNGDSNKLLIKSLFVCFGKITDLFIACVKIVRVKLEIYFYVFRLILQYIWGALTEHYLRAPKM